MSRLIQTEGPLFEAVQRARLFSDPHTFVDASPKEDADFIALAYEQQRHAPDFELSKFIGEHFDLPADVPSPPLNEESLDAYTESLWTALRREPEEEEPGSTLIPLVKPYLVPFAGARAFHYWDSYFSALGLVEAGHLDLAEDTLHNLVHLQERVGHVPGGNRHYLATRSAPPVLSLLVRLLWEARYWGAEDGLETVGAFVPSLEKEHAFWMNTARAVKLPDGALLNRYWDSASTPRPEAYLADSERAQASSLKSDLYRHVRAAAESGWSEPGGDVSERWLKVAGKPTSVRTTDVLPVDLNCLLYELETTLVGFLGLLGELDKQADYLERAGARKEAIRDLFWNEREGFYVDYVWRTRSQGEVLSLAGVLPLFTRVAEPEQAERVKTKLMGEFLKPGGLLASLSGAQAATGLAPLQWFAVQGLRHYGFHEEAETVATHWLMMTRQTFEQTKTLFTAYDVVRQKETPAAREASACSAGVTLKLSKLYPGEASQ